MPGPIEAGPVRRKGVRGFFSLRGVHARPRVNSTRREQAAAPPPEPPAQERLLTEIRDLLKRRP